MGFWKHKITLISVSSTRNANGYPERTETETEVYADVKSVSRSEFYEALRAGKTVDVSFDVYGREYTGQKYVEYGGNRYTVVRTYRKGESDIMELNCQLDRTYNGEDDDGNG